MKRLVVLTLTYALLAGCTPHKPNAQPVAGGSDRPVGGRCEGCNLYREGMPAKPGNETTIAAINEPGERLTISGTIFKSDGRTPASDIILYLYQTDQAGLYSPAKGQTLAREHGHLRGWIKTGADGRYTFHTILPGSYPNSSIPRHIHPIIKEAGLSEYYIDDYLFDNDPFLTTAERNKLENRGGSGIISITKDAGGTWIGKRDIILGKKIPGY